MARRNTPLFKGPFMLTALAATLLATGPARADVVSEWDLRDCQIVTSSGVGTPEANRVLAIAHTAAFEAANAISGRFADAGSGLHPEPAASIDAAIASAHRHTMSELLPAQRPAIERAYEDALRTIADDAQRSAGIALGTTVATAVLARRADDSAAAGARESYRPSTTPGLYVPTATPVASQWPQRRPWLMSSASQFRPAPPPALSSSIWLRDLNEVKALGARTGSTRSVEQTAIARFWETTLPTIYHSLIRNVAALPGREVTQNARLFAAVTQAADDAVIAVFDAKYYYGFWRPITAIRNADKDGNNATERDATWLPLIDTPLHPEYPCAHCIVSAAIGTVLQAEIDTGTQPLFSTSSPTANDAVRSWSSIEAFMREVANARIYDGVHYRNSTEIGTAMGRSIGALAVARFPHH
jgi:PAP2 superfamily